MWTNWTLEQKIGQMVMCGFDGTEPSAQIRRLVEEYRIGGAIYFARNVRDVAQVAALSRSLQRIAEEAGTAPLWISIDQEGGMVARITEGVALLPGNMAIAAGGDPGAAYEAGRICGEELRRLGINLNFAPVLDVNVNPRNPVIGVRSYGESPERVAEFGANMIRGLQASNVTATAKHFPGHGDTDVDSHLDLPVIAHDRERLRQVELVPFVRAIEEGVDAIMSAHVYFPAFEPDKRPVTLSHSVLTGLLREQLGFDGLVMTDCMEMEAIVKHYGTVPAAVLAVEAGADLVLISHSYERQTGAIAAIAAAVREGRIAEEQIDRSVERLLAMKGKRGLLDGGAVPESAEVGTAEHLATARMLSEASVTLVRNRGDALPLRPEPVFVVTVSPGVVTMVDETFSATSATLGEALRQCGLTVRELVVPHHLAAAFADKAAEEAAEFGQVVVATYNAHLHPGQAKLLAALRQAGRPLTVVATRNPYDYAVCQAADAFVCVYESRPLALTSAARCLAGLLEPTGKLPVSLGPGAPAGTGGGCFDPDLGHR